MGFLCKKLHSCVECCETVEAFLLKKTPSYTHTILYNLWVDGKCKEMCSKMA